MLSDTIENYQMLSNIIKHVNTIRLHWKKNQFIIQNDLKVQIFPTVFISNTVQYI